MQGKLNKCIVLPYFMCVYSLMSQWQSCQLTGAKKEQNKLDKNNYFAAVQ